MYKLTASKYLHDSEVDTLLQTLEKFTESNHRDTTMIYFLLNTGARATEMLEIRVSDLNAETKSVHIIGLKDSMDRDFPLPDWLYDRLSQCYSPKFHCSKHETYNSDCHECNMIKTIGKSVDDRLFPINYNRLRDIWTEYRPCPKKLHALRHTFAVRTYRKTKDIWLVKRALGHKSFKNTQIYLDFQFSIDDLRRIHE
jgi:site-specific recombinase XerD